MDPDTEHLPPTLRGLVVAVGVWIEADSGSIYDRQRAREGLHEAWDSYCESMEPTDA